MQSHFHRIDSYLAESVGRASEIIRRMRRFGGKGESRKSTVGIGEIVQEVQTLLAHDLRHAGVDCHIDIDPGLPLLVADRIQVQQVLVNLVLNAVHAMGYTEPDARRLTITAKVVNGQMTVAITDTGCGFSPGDPGKLFDAFYTTKPQGTGLGLSICRTIVEAHNGSITATPNPDRGATFTFTLPVPEGQ